MKKGYFSRRIFVTGYPGAVTHGELMTQFEEFGRIVGTKMIMANGHEEFPYSFIEFNTSIDATSARNKMHHALVRGQRLEVHFDSRIPPQFRPHLDDLEGFVEPSRTPPHQSRISLPQQVRRSSQESIGNESVAAGPSPQSSPDRAELRRPTCPIDRRPTTESHKLAGGPPESRGRYESGGYQGSSERRWPSSTHERATSGPARHQRLYSRGSATLSGGPTHYQQRLYTREKPTYRPSEYQRNGPPSQYGHPRNSRNGPPTARQSYREGYPARERRYEEEDHQVSYNDYPKERSRSPAYRRRGEEEYRRPESPESGNEYQSGEEYGNMTPPRDNGRSPSVPTKVERVNSQTSIGLYKDGGRWQNSNNSSPSDAEKRDDHNDDALFISPEVRPRSDIE